MVGVVIRPKGPCHRVGDVSVRMFVLALALMASLGMRGAIATPLDVRLVNLSEPAECAEVDNVDVRFRAPAPVVFTIEASHPAYFGADTKDLTAPVWTGCEGYADSDPVFPAQPAKSTLYEDARWLLTGVRYESFWRPAVVPVHVGDRRFDDLHLIQLHAKRPGRTPIEVVVLYPPDGYWRPKPLPPTGRPKTAFGSSFLIGPVEEQIRPVVELTEVRFEPAQGRFRLGFARGGTGSLTVTAFDERATQLAVRLDYEGESQDVAALRSMFVAPAMADTAVVRWQDAAGHAGRAAVLTAPNMLVRAATFLRETPSQRPGKVSSR